MNSKTFPKNSPAASNNSDASKPARQRVIGFIGNCQAELLHRSFRRIAPEPQFRTFYHFFNVPQAQQKQAIVDLNACDVLLVQDIQNFETYSLKDAIPREMQVVRFPFLSFAAPWPYDDFNGLRDNFARNQDHPSLHTTTYYDGALARLRRMALEPTARMELYSSLDIKGLVSPERVLDFETRRLEALDERFGLSIGRYILDGFSSRQLFYTVNRPCGDVLKILMEYLLAALELNQPVPSVPEFDEFKSIQVPIHPLVAKRLGMNWAKEGRLYRIDERSMDWECWVRNYIARYS